MSDPIGRDVSPGEPLEIPADSFNLMMRAARRQRDREFGETGGEYGNNPLSAGARVFVRNDTGGNLPGYSVLKLGTPLMDATNPDLVHDLQAMPVFPGTAPATAGDPFAIAIAPMPAGEMAMAVVLGVVVCDVEVSDVDHNYAAPATFTTKLASAVNGPVKIIWKDAGVGLKRALVALTGQTGTGGGGTGGGGITVEEVDLSPSYAATVTLRFDQTDGFVLTQPAAGIARVDQADATASQAGKVSTIAQTFGGAKTFAAAVVCSTTLTVVQSELIGAMGANWLSVPVAAQTLSVGGPVGIEGTIEAHGGLVATIGGYESGASNSAMFVLHQTVSQLWRYEWVDGSPASHRFDAFLYVLTGKHVMQFDSGSPSGGTYHTGWIASPEGFAVGSGGGSGTYNYGINATKTVKDGAGVNQTVTIKGGLITGWT